MLASLSRAIPSFSGLSVDLVRNGHRFSLTAADQSQEQAATSSLQWAIAQPGFRDETLLTFYARQAGAFVDLAADLNYAIRHRSADDRGPADAAIVLDQNVPSSPLTSGITGVRELSVVNMAIGILIDRGTPPARAMHELVRQAAAAGMATPTYARSLLGNARTTVRPS